MANVHPIRPGAHGAADEVNLELDDTQGEGHAAGGHQPPILVLSRDESLIETVRKAAPRGASVSEAPDLDQIAARLPTLQPGVLVADTASTSDVAAMVAQLTQHFPELVVVVAGKREDSAALMQLTAAGRIFRFLLTPLSHGQTRLALEAAVTHHIDLRAAGQRLEAGNTGGGGGKNYVATYAALTGGLLLVIGGIWFGVSRFTSEPEVPPVALQPSTETSETPSVFERPDPVQAEIALAREAFAQGRYLEPPGESALDLFRSALALDPQNEEARAGIRSVTDKILERAEESLTAERLEEAILSIEIARDIEPDHPRLSFLDTQIARERERLKLSQAQEVGSRVRTLLAQANTRIQQGRLISPSGSSARDALLEARRLDPTDPAVTQGIRQLGEALAGAADQAMSVGDRSEAQTLVNAARQLGFAGAALASVERQIAEANRVASATPAAAPAPRASASGASPRPGSAPALNDTQNLVASIRQRLNEGKLVDPAGDSARDWLRRLEAAAPNAPEFEELSRALTTRLLEAGRMAMTASVFDRSAQLIAAARDVGARFDEASIAQAERELIAARDDYNARNNIVSASSLKRTRTVSPVYPDTARKRGIEGWVELAFTVTPNGTVDDIEVRNASPANVFDDAAVRAVRQWRFEPVVRNGERVSQRAMVRLRFSQSD